MKWGQSDEYGKRKWKHRHTCIHRHAISALVLQYYALMCKHMHTERLDFFQTSIDMHIYYKITAQDRRYVHIQAHMHSLSFFLALAESVKAQKGWMFYQKHPSQHQTLHLTTTQSKKIMSLLHQTDHFRKTVCWFFVVSTNFDMEVNMRAVGTQNNQKSQSSLLFTFLLYIPICLSCMILTLYLALVFVIPFYIYQLSTIFLVFTVSHKTLN